MLKTITIDTDIYAVVPRVPTVSNEMKYKFIGEFSWTEETAYYDEDGIEHDSELVHTVPWDLCKTIFKQMAAHWIAATPQPEQAQQSDFDPIVPESALEVGAKAVELAMQAGVTSPRTLALAAYTDIALTLHKAGQQPAPRQIPPINQELDEFISGLVAKELAKRGSRKIETAPRPVLTVTLGKGDKLVADIFQEDEDGILRMAGVGIFDPEPGKVYGIGAKNEAIDGKAITEGNPLILIWSDKPESLQVIVEELQESIARMTRPAEPDGGAV